MSARVGQAHRTRLRRGNGPSGYFILMATTPIAPDLSRPWCVGALIIDPGGRIFAQRRSATRRLFPDTWDIVGGHVETGEGLLETLAREIAEETGWQLADVLARVCETTWTGNDGITRRETDYLVTVTGELSAPRLEAGKHSDGRWITPADLGLFEENREPGDDLLRRIVAEGFAVARRLGYAPPAAG